DERHDFVHPLRRIDEARIRAVVIEEFLRVRGELEEVVLLGRPLDRMSALVFAVLDLVLGDERLFALAVPAGVLAEVDVARLAFLDAPNELENTDAMPRLSGTNEIVVADVELRPQLVVVRDDAIGELDR